MKQQIKTTSQELAMAEDQLPPDGSILLVDDPAACPSGWVDIAQEEPTFFAGRTLLAVGEPPEEVSFEYRDRRGAKSHKLTTAQMPSHSHELRQLRRAYDEDPNADGFQPGKSFSDGDHPGRVWVGGRPLEAKQSTDKVGENAPHTNMPPYLAVYFCKKER